MMWDMMRVWRTPEEKDLGCEGTDGVTEEVGYNDAYYLDAEGSTKHVSL